MIHIVIDRLQSYLHHSWSDISLVYITVIWKPYQRVCSCASTWYKHLASFLLEAGWRCRWPRFVRWAHRVWCMNMAERNTQRKTAGWGEPAEKWTAQDKRKRKCRERQWERVVSQCLKREGLNQKEGRLNWASSLKRNYLSISKLN